MCITYLSPQCQDLFLENHPGMLQLHRGMLLDRLLSGFELRCKLQGVSTNGEDGQTDIS